MSGSPVLDIPSTPINSPTSIQLRKSKSPRKLKKNYRQLVIQDRRKPKEQLISEFWGITTFFNPYHFQIKNQNYRFFRTSSQRQGLQLMAVELSYDGQFELQEGRDAEIHLKLLADPERSVLWQRERLLNVALKHLPASCLKICWIDCDLLFQNDKWVWQTSQLLEKYPVVQPFQKICLLPQGHQDLKKLKKKDYPDPLPGSAYYYLQTGKYRYKTQSGFVWAVQRSIIDQIKFYDRSVIGGGDRVWTHSLFFPQIPDHYQPAKNGFLSVVHAQDMNRYVSRFHKLVQRQIYYTQGRIHHLWHGNHVNRKYNQRHLILKKYQYDPQRDLQISPSGCWNWKETAPLDLVREVKEYFQQRQEDG